MHKTVHTQMQVSIHQDQPVATGLHHHVLMRQHVDVLCCAHALLCTLWFQSLVGTPLCQVHFSSNAKVQLSFETLLTYTDEQNECDK